MATLGTESVVLVAGALLASGRTWPGLRRLVAVALPFAGGALLVIGPLAAWFVIARMIDGFVLDLVTLAARNYPVMRNLPLPRFSDWRSLGVYQPAIVLVACFPVLSLVGWRRHNVALPTMTAAFTAIFFAEGWVRVSIIHMSPAIVSSLALMALVRPHARRLGRPAAIPVVGGCPLRRGMRGCRYQPRAA